MSNEDVFQASQEALRILEKDYQCNIKNDPVSHPSHYTSGKYEVINIIEDQLGTEGIRGFCLGNTIKYICRSGKKDPTKSKEDLEKAAWYLDHYIKILGGANGRT